MQIVGYVTAGADGDADAELLLAADGEIHRRTLAPGAELASVLGERRCAGRLTDDGHEPCDANGAPYCDLHTSRWPCARCTGECDLPIDNCHEEHVVYLAAFAPDEFKVGVTKPWRLTERLREQGADRGARLRTVANGRVAREIEAEIAADVGDSVRVRTKIDGLDRSVDEAAWRSFLAAFEPRETYGFAYDLGLDERPMAETLATGTVRGTKGRILVLERAGSTYAVDLRDLVGYEVSEGESDRDLQSSIGAFE